MPEDAPGGDEPTQEAPEGDVATEQPPAPTPPIDWESDDNPFKQRYNEVRPEYDRMQNVVNALEDPDTQARLMRMWGYEVEDAEADDQPDPDEPLTRAEWQAHLDQQQAQQQAAQQADQMLDSDADFAEQEFKRLSIAEEDIDEVLTFALANRDEQGRLGIEAAHTKLNGFFDRRLSAYKTSKKSQAVPDGQAGTEKVDLGDDDARAQLLANMLEAGEQD